MRRWILIGIFLLLTGLPLQAQDNSGYAEAQRRIDDALAWDATELHLDGLQLTHLPDNLSLLTHLKVLDISDNQLSTIPTSVLQMSQLTYLNLSNNGLTTLPENIDRLKNLDELDLTGNRLTVLPDSMGHLENLEALFLNGNHLSTLPESLTHLHHLQEMHVSFNRFTSLPPFLGQLPLKTLDISENALVFPPPEVVTQGSATILSYLRDYEQIRARQVLAMGAGGIGLVTGFGLLWRWRTHRGKQKKKHG